MKKTKSLKTRLVSFFTIPFYFLLYAIYPVLALLNYNIPQIRFTAGIRSLIVVAVLVSAFFLLFRWIFKNNHKAAFAVTFLTILFFSYGQVADFLKSRNLPIPYQKIGLGGIWVLLAVLVVYLAGKGGEGIKNAALPLNFVSLGLVIYSMVLITWWSFPVTSANPADDHAPIQELLVTPGQVLPDIYYIIDDSYGRSDLLKSSFDIDNSEYISGLQDLGFYVADCSQSNYNRTDVSLGSSLNLEYLQNLDTDFIPGKEDRRTLWDSILHSTVRYELESVGYQTVAFSTGFAWSEISDADVYISPSLTWSALTGFETLLIRTTPGRYLEDLNIINLDQIDGQRFRERTQLILDSMERLARMPGPKFVFIHLLPPHPPFVFDPDGSYTDPTLFLNANHVYTAATYTQGYQNEVKYINNQMLPALSTLLEESTTPPVIILQGDHAPWMQTGYKKFLILNAYHLPDGKNSLLYPSISPVNTFRLVLDTYFGTTYSLLKDISYYSPIPDIYNFQEFPNPCMVE
jgi:hypothetical protein